MDEPKFEVLRRYNTTTAYDIFHDKGTYYGGKLIAAARRAESDGDVGLAGRYHAQNHLIDKQRNDVNPDDVDEMISYLQQWSDMCDDIVNISSNAADEHVPIDRGVSDTQLVDIFDNEIKTQVFGSCILSDNPVSIFFGAQPAAGKTLGQLRVRRMHEAGTIVSIIGDDYRKFHLNYERMMEEVPLDMPDMTAYAAGRWTGMCVRYADENGYSDIIEGTWRNSDTVINEAKTASSYGRKCHAVIIAVPPALSRIGFLSRYYASLEIDGNARWTPPTAHEKTITNLENTMREIAASGLFENYSAIKRDGSVLYDGDDAWKWIEPWRREFLRELTDGEHDVLENEISEIISVCTEHTPEIMGDVSAICNAARK